MTTKTLRIARGLALPLDYVTQTAAILAQRRKGKTYTANVIAEEMVSAGLPFVALDPTGAWYGLRSSTDGKTAGLPVVVLGGQHGDITLNRKDGRVVADLVIEQPGWYVIDFGLFESGAAEREFATDFAERLYRRKGQAGSDFPLHLFVDEADRFVPQQVRGGKGEARETDQRMLGAFEAIVRRGGLRGLGTTLISQRAAVVNKNVLEQLDLLIMLRTVGPNDQDAVDNYIRRYASSEQRAALMGSLASLDIGEAWIYEPGGDPPLFDRVRIRERRTFNSSATPKVGERRVEPRAFADVDLAAVKEQMAETIARADAEDPKKLRARIVELERALAKAERDRPEPQIITETVEVHVEHIPPSIVAGLTAAHDHAAELTAELLATLGHAVEANETTQRTSPPETHSRGDSRRSSSRPSRTSDGPRAQRDRTGEVSPAGKAPAPNVGGTNPDIKIGGGALRMLAALADFPNGLTRSQLATRAKLKRKGGTFGTYLSRLTSAGCAVVDGQHVTITDGGRAHIGAENVAALRGPELLQSWRDRLGGAGARRMLDTLIDAWPLAISREELAGHAGVEQTGGTFGTYLSRLRSNELVDTYDDLVRARDDFMEAIR